MERYKFFKNREGVKGKDARKERFTNARKDKRLELLEKLRAMDDVASENPPNVVEHKKSRLELLKEWKLQKAQKENLNKQTKRPPFYAGKMQTKATGSPMLAPAAGAVTRSRAKANNIPIIKPTETIKKRKAPLKLQQLNKIEDNALKPVENYLFVLPKAVTDLAKLTIPKSPKITKSARKSIKPLFESIKKESEVNSMICNQLEDHELKAPKAKRRITAKELLHVTESVFAPSQIREPSTMTENENIDCRKDNVDRMDYSPDQSPRPVNNFQHLNYSPFVEKKRGSHKNRRSSKKSMTFNEKVDAEIAEEEIIFKAKIASFRLFLKNETCRLLGLSEMWVNYLQCTPNLPSDVEGEINAVAGKTKLLTSDKFKQFEGLINKCEECDPKIKLGDLEGFHDWVSLEIEDLDKVFSKLEERKNNNWVPEAPKVQKFLHKKKPVVTVAPKRTAPSNMRAFIMAARNKVQTGAEESHSLAKHPTLPARSPIPSPRSGTPRDRTNLRIQVLQRSSGLAVLAATAAARASLSPSKSPDVEKTVPQSPPSITLSKSILKTTPSTLSEKKSVVFRELDPEDSVFDSELAVTIPRRTLRSSAAPCLMSTPEISLQKTLVSLTNKKNNIPYYLLPDLDSSNSSSIGLALLDSPLENSTVLEKIPTLLPKKMSDPKYLLPALDSSIESPLGLTLLDDTKSSDIPLRRSSRKCRKT